MTLFDATPFTSHSGKPLDFKIECDFLTTSDWLNLAAIVARRVQFGAVIGVPRGGLTFAWALESYATEGPTLIVDDVLTTGASMEEYHKHADDIGVVVFCRKPFPWPSWITPLFVASDFLTTTPGTGVL